MKYSLILADCPWKYNDEQGNDPARGGITYKTLEMKDIYNLPVHNIAEDNSILVFWVTLPKLTDTPYDAFSIMRNWGFKPVTGLFVWVKLNRKVTMAPDDIYADSGEVYFLHMSNFYSGLGRYTNSNVEIAFVGRRGKGLPRVNKNVKQLIFSPLRKHSEKPPEQYQRLYDLYGDVSRIELFARKQNPPPEGWDAVGIEWQPSIDIRDFLKQHD
jgi:N6-adenosine-specific RNA methylase IME4